MKSIRSQNRSAPTIAPLQIEKTVNAVNPQPPHISNIESNSNSLNTTQVGMTDSEKTVKRIRRMFRPIPTNQKLKEPPVVPRTSLQTPTQVRHVTWADPPLITPISQRYWNAEDPPSTQQLPHQAPNINDQAFSEARSKTTPIQINDPPEKESELLSQWMMGLLRIGQCNEDVDDHDDGTSITIITM